MKFTLPWLKEHLETEARVEEIGSRLTALGLEVDSIVARGADLSPFVVAEVTAVRPHPDAERLSVCTVERGDGAPLEVVCGAPNVRPGMKAVFAAVGTVIPASGEVLRKATIRGVESNGMLCSARELRLGEDHTGIIELDPATPVGGPASRALASEGPVFDVELTPNRADCFGVHGIARDLSAGGLGTLKWRDLSPVPPAFETGFQIHLDFPEGEAHACPLYVGRVFRGLTNRPSPRWLQERLSAVGLRPISALVDITNLVTLDLNRPLHVFDAAKLRGEALTIRFARGGEALEALDGRTYELGPGMTVIADERGPVGLGGIMGGEESGCTASTTDMVLEVALFDPQRTASTGRALGIESDARTRFERGLDPGMVLPGMEYATRLILDLCGGEASQPIVAGAVPGPRPPIRFRMAQLERLTGIALHGAVIERHVRALGFGAEWVEDGVLQVWPPSWRHDITMEADVVEELVRLHGYDKVPPMPVTRTAAVGQTVLTPEQRLRGIARRALAARGLAEAVTWSFTEPSLAERFGNAGIRLKNPLNAELSVMRPSVLTNLVSAAARNQARGIGSIGLFEVGPRFSGARPGEQEWAAGGIRIGTQHERHWLEPARPVDVFDVRADAMAALTAGGLNTEAVRVVADGPEHYHPGRKGRLTLGPQTVLAEFGEIHPAILEASDLEGPAVAFEVFLDRLPKPRSKRARARPPLKASPYPPVDRDFAFVVDDDVPAEALLQAVRSAEKALIREVQLFDVYAGRGLDPGRKSLAVAVRLQASDRTLAEAEIEGVVRKIVAAAGKATGATLRA
ncbi:MAG TPA: phenylalanine--tRNA ligase subunit beta [Geminicoccaceae bacterium]